MAYSIYNPEFCQSTSLPDIKLDKISPTGSIVINNGASVTGQASVTLSLSASDHMSGVEPDGQMMLSNDGSTWSPSLPYATNAEWDFTLHGGNDDEGIRTVYVKFMDAAGNWMQDPVSDDIRLDMTGPTGTVVINNGLTSTRLPLVRLTLSASDESGVELMQFSNDGVNWSPLEDYNTIKNDWDISASEYGGDSDEGEKIVYVQFVDGVGNINKQGVTGSIGFKTGAFASIQIFAPEVEGKIKNGNQVAVDGISESNLAIITLDILDDSGRLLAIDLTTVIYEASTGQITGSFNVGELTAKTIQFKVSVEDSLGNQAEAVSNALVVDNEPPGNTGMSIAQASPVNSTSVDLSMSATDALEMYISGDVKNQTTWIPFAEALTIQLTASDGTKQVMVKFRDDMKNESDETVRQIVLDTIPPTSEIVINNSDEFAKIFLVTLTLSASDRNGVESYRLSNNGSKWTDELAVNPVMPWDYEWDLTLSDYGGSLTEGTRSVYVKYKDRVGNWSAPISDSIQAYTTAPTVSVALANEQEVLESVTVTAKVESNRTITTAKLYYRRKGQDNYVEIAMAKSSGSDYTAEIPGQEVTFVGVEYYVSVSDGLWNITYPAENAAAAPGSFAVVDTTSPTIVESEPVNRVQVQTSLEITATVTDAVGVTQVSLLHKHPADRDFTRIIMVAEPNSDIYSSSIPKQDQLGSLQYYIEVTDSSSNTATSPIHTVPVVDTVPPIITHAAVSDGRLTGQAVLIEATITDDLPMAEAILKYKKQGESQWVEVAMTGVESYYSAKIPGNAVASGIVDYAITASDGSPLSENAEVAHSFTVFDPPTTTHDYDGEWHNADFFINLTGHDQGNGISSIRYRINDDAERTVSEYGFPWIDMEGDDNKLEYWSVDNSDNEGKRKSLLEIKLDKTEPVLSNWSIHPDDLNVDTVDVCRIDVRVTDNLSGFRNPLIAYHISSSYLDYQSMLDGADGSWYFVITEDWAIYPGETLYYTVKVEDEAGNIVETEKQETIDKLVPDKPGGLTAIELDSSLKDSHFSLGMALSRTGKYSDAAIQFEKSLELSPDWFEAHMNLGSSYLKL